MDRRQRQIVLDMLVVQADGHTLDLPAMQQRYQEALRDEGRFQARELLLIHLRHHIGQVCRDKTRDGQETQIRLAANAVFAPTAQPLYRDGECWRVGQ